MKNNNAHPLEQELLEAGASQDEAQTLANIAQSLHQLKGTEPPPAGDIRLRLPLPRRRSRLAALIFGLGLVGSLAVGLAIASVAQTTYPSNFLYPVKRLTENLAVMIQPNYRGVLMMRRAVEVKQLVAVHAEPQLINATLASYKTQVADYKGGNYEDFEYCESTLRQAEKIATGTERTAIAQTIASVKT
jgi:hypothetical protein